MSIKQRQKDKPTKKQISKQTHRPTEKPKHIQTDIQAKKHPVSKTFDLTQQFNTFV